MSGELKGTPSWKAIGAVQVSNNAGVTMEEETCGEALSPPSSHLDRCLGRRFDSQFVGNICLTAELGEVQSLCVHFVLLPTATLGVQQSSTLMHCSSGPGLSPWG